MRKFKCVSCLNIFPDKKPCILETDTRNPKNCPSTIRKAIWFEIQPCTMPVGKKIEDVLDVLEEIVKGIKT